MSSQEFRAELVKIMPGYSWTVHQQRKYHDILKDELPLSATGIQSSGSNRLSTLRVIRRVRDGCVVYQVMSSGYGTRAPWLHECHDGTLARALRSLQNHYENTAATYRSHADALRLGRSQAKEVGDHA